MYQYKKPHFFSFSGRMTIGEFWSSFFSSIMGGFATLMLLCIILCLAVPGETEELSKTMNWICLANGLFWLVHIAALSRRRLRDSGFTAKSYLWLLLPGAGLVIFIVKLCARTVE